MVGGRLVVVLRKRKNKKDIDLWFFVIERSRSTMLWVSPTG